MRFLRVIIIIPAFNEAEAILSTVNEVKRAGYDYIVINDGSTDDTLSICRENNLNVLDLPQNLGIGGAVQAGHKYALTHDYDIDIQFDGDGQHDVSYLGDLIESVSKGNDLVIGSRFLTETDGFKSTWLRRVGKTWLSGAIKFVTGKEITDPTSGFRACGKNAISLFCRSYPTDYPEPESIVSALRRGLSVAEVPVAMRERQGGKSSIGALSSVYYMVKVTLAIFVVAVAKKS